MSDKHKYDLPDPSPHDALRTAACISQLVGILLGAVGIAALVGLALGHLILLLTA